MKILHLIQKPQLRGAEIFTSQLASHLNENGHQAILVSLYLGDADLPFEGKKINLNGVFQNRLLDVKAWLKLAKIIREEKPDVIQANAGDTLKYAVFSRLLFRWKQPIVFRNASIISSYIKTKLSKILYSFLFGHVDKIVSVSTVSALDFAALFPQYKKKITTIPVGIEHSFMNGLEEKANQGNGHSTYYGGPILVHIGGFTFEKNHVGLINIFERIVRERPTASLHLIGDGILRNDIEELARKKNLDKKICFHGYKNNVSQFIRNADVLLLPSLLEGLPGVILEAFVCKTPVVAYDTGGIKEIVISKHSGYLIKKGNEEEFAFAVLASLEKNTYNEMLIENAYRLVTSKYFNTQITKEFVSVYESIVSE